MIVTNKNQARWYKEISFRALPEQNVKLRGDQIIVTTFFKKSLNPQTSTSFLNG